MTESANIKFTVFKLQAACKEHTLGSPHSPLRISDGINGCLDYLILIPPHKRQPSHNPPDLDKAHSAPSSPRNPYSF